MVALALSASWLLSSIGAVEGLSSLAAFPSASRLFRVISIPAHIVEAPRKNVSALPDRLSSGTLRAYEPVWPENSDLLLFLAGSTRTCEFYSEFLEVAAASMRVLCVPYDNRQAISLKCLLDKACYRRLRTKALDGDFNKVRKNNIEGRVVSALQYLSRTDGPAWGKYLNATSGLPLWRSYRVAGHSQGAGNAAWIGYHREVARVVQLSGVCDRSDWPQREGPPATPGSRFFGLGHSLDQICSTKQLQETAWRAEGALKQGESSLELKDGESISGRSLRGAQTVISHILPPVCKAKRRSKQCHMMAHDSPAAGDWGGEKSPYASGVWQDLIGI